MKQLITGINGQDGSYLAELLIEKMFFLQEGSGTSVIEKTTYVKHAPYSVLVSAGQYHAFNLTKGSVLLCLASELHDPKDDYTI